MNESNDFKSQPHISKSSDDGKVSIGETYFNELFKKHNYVKSKSQYSLNEDHEYLNESQDNNQQRDCFIWAPMFGMNLSSQFDVGSSNSYVELFKDIQSHKYCKIEDSHQKVHVTKLENIGKSQNAETASSSSSVSFYSIHSDRS